MNCTCKAGVGSQHAAGCRILKRRSFESFGRTPCGACAGISEHKPDCAMVEPQRAATAVVQPKQPKQTKAGVMVGVLTGSVMTKERIGAIMAQATKEIAPAAMPVRDKLHALIEHQMRQAAQDGVDDGEMLARIVFNAFVLGIATERAAMEVCSTDNGSVS